jgi:hypothetical protein
LCCSTTFAANDTSKDTSKASTAAAAAAKTVHFTARN